MTMDAGRVGAAKLFVTDLLSNIHSVCSTYSICVIEALDHIRLRDLIVDKLAHLDENGLHVSAITCDGASYQVKALDFNDASSIQATQPLFSKLLFIPWLYHRVNNACHCLYRTCQPFKRLIQQLRELDNFCWKPVQRQLPQCSCPQLIKTRWLYEHRILLFVIEHEEVINGFPGVHPRMSEEFYQLRSLLTTFFKPIPKLEAFGAALGSVYSTIKKHAGN
jgi:hypothetical protein